MIMKYCPLKKILNNCSLCRENTNKYYLENIEGKRYPIIRDDNHITHIMHYNNIDYIDDINKYLNLGIRSYRIELFDENKNEIVKIINLVRNKISN